jgi:hypothetical protein
VDEPVAAHLEVTEGEGATGEFQRGLIGATEQ